MDVLVHISSELDYSFNKLRVAVKHLLVPNLSVSLLYVVAHVVYSRSSCIPTGTFDFVNLIMYCGVVFHRHSGLYSFHAVFHAHIFQIFKHAVL